ALDTKPQWHLGLNGHIGKLVGLSPASRALPDCSPVGSAGASEDYSTGHPAWRERLEKASVLPGCPGAPEPEPGGRRCAGETTRESNGPATRPRETAEHASHLGMKENVDCRSPLIEGNQHVRAAFTSDDSKLKVRSPRADPKWK